MTTPIPEDLLLEFSKKFYCVVAPHQSAYEELGFVHDEDSTPVGEFRLNVVHKTFKVSASPVTDERALFLSALAQIEAWIDAKHDEAVTIIWRKAPELNDGVVDSRLSCIKAKK